MKRKTRGNLVSLCMKMIMMPNLGSSKWSSLRLEALWLWLCIPFFCMLALLYMIICSGSTALQRVLWNNPTVLEITNLAVLTSALVRNMICSCYILWPENMCNWFVQSPGKSTLFWYLSLAIYSSLSISFLFLSVLIVFERMLLERMWEISHSIIFEDAKIVVFLLIRQSPYGP